MCRKRQSRVRFKVPLTRAASSVFLTPTSPEPPGRSRLPSFCGRASAQAHGRALRAGGPPSSRQLVHPISDKATTQTGGAAMTMMMHDAEDWQFDVEAEDNWLRKLDAKGSRRFLALLESHHT